MLVAPIGESNSFKAFLGKDKFGSYTISVYAKDQLKERSPWGSNGLIRALSVNKSSNNIPDTGDPAGGTILPFLGEIASSWRDVFGNGGENVIDTRRMDEASWCILKAGRFKLYLDYYTRRSLARCVFGLFVEEFGKIVEDVELNDPTFDLKYFPALYEALAAHTMHIARKI